MFYNKNNHRARALVEDVEAVIQALRDTENPVNPAALQKIIDRVAFDVQALPVKKPVEKAYVSPLSRAQETLDIIVNSSGAYRAWRKAVQQTCGHIKEISLGRELTQEEVAQIAQEARQKKPLSNTSILSDTIEERKRLANIETKYDGGDTVSDYVQNVLKGCAAIVQKAGGQGVGKSVDELATTIPPATKVQIAHILYVQDYLKTHKKLPSDAHKPDLVYEPLSKAIEALPDGTRFVLCRHGNTYLSDLKKFAGGNVDIPLNEQGKQVAQIVGVLTGLLRAIDPSPHETVVVGHSGAHAVVNAALSTVLSKTDQRTDGTFKPDTPYIVEIRGGKISICELTADYLTEISSLKSVSRPSLQWGRRARTSCDA